MNSRSPALPSTAAPRRRWWRALGWVLCATTLLAAAGGCWFWYRVIDLERDELAYYAMASGENRLDRWHGIRNRFRRGYFSHDDMIHVRVLGDMEAVELIMGRLPAEGRVRGCLGSAGPAHAAEALEILTAHSAGSTAEEWHAWWRVHQGKSQATLIREAFKPLGIDPQKPPTKEQSLFLLRLIGLADVLGPPNSNDLGPPRPTKAHTFNAMRILRDHDVKPDVVTREDLTGPDGESILKGLTAYVKFKAENPASNEAGVVFGTHEGYTTEDYIREQSWMLWSPWAPWAWWGGQGVLAAAAVWGARALWRTRPKCETGRSQEL